jgi:hypothetical protein
METLRTVWEGFDTWFRQPASNGLVLLALLLLFLRLNEQVGTVRHAVGAVQRRTEAVKELVTELLGRSAQ